MKWPSCNMTNHEDKSHVFMMAEQKVGKNPGPRWHHGAIILLVLDASISSSRRQYKPANGQAFVFLAAECIPDGPTGSLHF